jgi:hypothetical protein
VVPIALEVEHSVDHVLEHARAGECAFLGDVPDKDDRGAGGFGKVHKLGAAPAQLGDRAGRGFEVGLVDHLNRVNHADIWFDLACLLHDAREIGIAQHKQVVGVRDVEALGSHLDLLRGFFGRNVQDLARPVGIGLVEFDRRSPCARSLEQQCGLADAGFAADEHDTARDKPFVLVVFCAAEDSIEFADAGGQAPGRCVGGADLGDGGRDGCFCAAFGLDETTSAAVWICVGRFVEGRFFERVPCAAIRAFAHPSRVG